MKRAYVGALLAFLLSGCVIGPINIRFLPATMVERVSAENQHQFDRMWDNLLTPVNRADRQILVDAIEMYHLVFNGVDEAHIVTRKQFSGGEVVMEVFFDRANPETDRVEVHVLDLQGRPVRDESYSRSDLEAALQGNPWVWAATLPDAEGRETPLPEIPYKPDQSADAKELQKKRIEKLRAALRPGGS